MKIALTGANGFLGRKILSNLNTKNYKTDTFRLNDKNKIDEFLNKISSTKYDYIINCAASINPKSKKEVYLNEELPVKIQNKISNNNSILIHISSLNVINESLSDTYSLSKKIAEKNLIKKNLIIIRPSLIINESFQITRNEFEKYTRLPFKYMPMIYPGNIYYPVNLNKLSKFILDLIDKKSNKFNIYNIEGSKKYNLWEIFNIYCETKNKKALKINIKFINNYLPTFIKILFQKNRILQNLLIIDRRVNKNNEGKKVIL